MQKATLLLLVLLLVLTSGCTDNGGSLRPVWVSTERGGEMSVRGRVETIEGLAGILGIAAYEARKTLHCPNGVWEFRDYDGRTRPSIKEGFYPTRESWAILRGQYLCR